MIQLKKPPTSQYVSQAQPRTFLIRDVEAPGGEPAERVQEDAQKRIGTHDASMSPGLYRRGRAEVNQIPLSTLTRSFSLDYIPGIPGVRYCG